ncbi:Protein NRT1/ PTR FAMILY 5.1 [Rhynchospora pubera]|uniref:Protein NRT1/ PTR FAMILY 5.1 n=1 Tax=Rhynchospora pubera TaxID=906938 RepID=A0AAV8C7I6_9POAL|nr:Protein NRT1/ PTR FAMILY 5.1 [Rhynchospora pubera]
MGLAEEARISLLAAEENQNENISSSTSVLKQQTGGWKASSLILFTELCVCIVIFGILKNLVVYLKTELLEDNVTAATHASTWLGSYFLAPLIGAYVSDSYWGNYLTIMSFCIINFAGMVTFTLSTSLSILKHSSFFTFFGLYMISLGSGSIQPCLSAFGADQFDTAYRKAKASFFSWYYLSIKIGLVFSSTVILWIQDNYGWTIGFSILTLLSGIACVGLMAGSRHYRYCKPSGSPFTRIRQVIVAASRKYKLDLPEDYSLLYQAKGEPAIVQDNKGSERTPEFSFLDKAAIVAPSDFSCSGALSPWRLCTMLQVEELKSILRLLPVWATFILFASVSSQESSVFLEQGMVMDRHFGSLNIPAASLSSFNVLAVVVFAPIYDKIIVPVACRITKTEGGMSHLQRAGIGLLFSILAMLSATIVETKRLQIASDESLTHQNVAVPMSVFWQIPRYVLVGIGEVFNQIGMLDFFYDQAPDSMRSLCLALSLLTVSLGSYVTSVVLAVVNGVTRWIPENLNEGHLDRFFLLFAGLSLFNLVVFAYCASRYRYKKK